MNFTLTLNKINDSDFNKVGYRALDLAKAHQDKVDVPPTFVVPNIFFDVFLSESGLDVKIQGIMRRINPNDEIALSEAVGKIRGLFKNTKIPKEYEEQLKEAYEALSVSTSFSSAQDFLVEEDIRVNLQISPNYLMEAESMKGIFLNVKGFNDFCDAVKSAWMSLLSSSEIIYRYKNGIKRFNTGIIVEKMTTLPVIGEVYTKGSFADYDFLIKGYRGLIDITKKIAKDEYSVTTESIKINGVVVRRQEYALLPSEKSTIIIKRSLGSKGEGQKLSNVQIEELARLSKKIKSQIQKDLKITYGLHNSGICCVSINRLEKPSVESEPEMQQETEPENQQEPVLESIENTDEQNTTEVMKDNFEQVEEKPQPPSEEVESEDILETEEESPPISTVDTSTLESKHEQVEESEPEQQHVPTAEALVAEPIHDEIEDDDEELQQSQKQTQEPNISEETTTDDLSNQETDSVQNSDEQSSESEVESVEIYETSEPQTQEAQESQGESMDDFILGDEQPEESSAQTAESQDSDSQTNEQHPPEHYIAIIERHEPNLHDKVYAIYRQKYGDEPLSLEDALARLSENAELVGLEAIQALKTLKDKLLSGEVPHMGNFEEIIREARKFPGE